MLAYAIRTMVREERQKREGKSHKLEGYIQSEISWVGCFRRRMCRGVDQKPGDECPWFGQGPRKSLI